VKSGFQSDGWASLPLADAAVDPCVARPDLGQQQGPIGKHRSSAEVWGTVEGKERNLEEVACRPPSGRECNGIPSCKDQTYRKELARIKAEERLVHVCMCVGMYVCE
jgi:hypothetical protein